MILKGSQRQGARRLASHLLNDRDNDHVSVTELRGFAASDLFGAMAEVEAITKGTKCVQSVFSLSLNPPKDAEVGIDGFISAADRAEEKLGLKDQPRAIVIHEKNGRRHAHVVWSRIDAAEMTAVNLPFFKTKLAALSKELYLEHGWELPDGHKVGGGKNPLNYTLAEWQQAKRQDMDPREIKQIFAGAWQHSDSLAGFRNALEEQGYYLAKGDRRGFVAVDLNGEVYSVARHAGVKAKEVSRKLGSPDALPGVLEVQDQLGEKVRTQVRAFLREDRAAKRQETARRVVAAGKRSGRSNDARHGTASSARPSSVHQSAVSGRR
ncbi:relaxase/mobilization nuclease domain-containing protein [Ancylobacter sp. 6x-1]|uniref:Relaxase/mobilization nuclease domain-containing protein n=1 Tax=Ancylobacter crimeensis TaxID=2579147 RepID=A0ABT0DD96_9HYPH|nr:relaxase/mobilization nuclease domain-containing protein [Ancylobacter crimeensis]MCK0197717.1 relaxase/mobilization nuclease domain-containing protein [Ancylobacter crimeensis]